MNSPSSSTQGEETYENKLNRQKYCSAKCQQSAATVRRRLIREASRDEAPTPNRCPKCWRFMRKDAECSRCAAIAELNQGGQHAE